ncbi:3751_t:CDS:2 [Funneliformis caledonium]|uniref:3751_t:CDS:1 n=1 Tax=Funneliformis caledonium TaxID=1117310 RepID=A0A9N8ZHQ7_9GLOM|nr:3751_t:CDS:2 [Funneliformis caledonium]
MGRSRAKKKKDSERSRRRLNIFNRNKSAKIITGNFFQIHRCLAYLALQPRLQLDRSASTPGISLTLEKDIIL